MAFTITPRNTVHFGPGAERLIFDFSCTNTDTATFTLPTGYIHGVNFYDANQNLITTQALSARAVSGGTTSYTLTSSGTIVGGTIIADVGGR